MAALQPGGCGASTPTPWGAPAVEHIQIPPQCSGPIDEPTAHWLRRTFPMSRFRLHAHAQVQIRPRFTDFSTFRHHDDWFRDAARVSQALRAPAYTGHAGRRRYATLKDVFRHARIASDWFDCPVGIEAQYPTPNGDLLIDCWDEYRQLLDSRVPFALDMSHIEAVAAHERREDQGLLQEMLHCERCLEIHLPHTALKGNPPASAQPWWLPVVRRWAAPAATLFLEAHNLSTGSSDLRSHEASTIASWQ